MRSSLMKSLAIGVGVLSASVAPVSACAYPAWAYSQKINFNTTSTGANLATDQLNFPVPVRLDATNFNFALAKAGGADIRFEDPNGSALKFQIDEWDAEAKKALIWVKVPCVSKASATDYIRMYFGNPSASSESSGPNVFTATAGYSGVFHMDEIIGNSETDLPFVDATANHADMVAYVNGQSKMGVAGKGQEFNGTGDYCEMEPPANWGITNKFTFSFWMYPTQNASEACIYDDVGTDLGIEIKQIGSKLSFRVAGPSARTNLVTNSIINNNTWYHVVYTFNAGAHKVYVNGAEVTSFSIKQITGVTSVVNNGRECYFGKKEDYTCYFKGSIDEFAIAKTVWANTWVKLCYESQKIGQKFISTESMMPKDSDGDTIPDVVESLVGQNPAGLGIPSSWVALGDEVQTVTYSYAKTEGFEHCGSVQVSLPANSVDGDLVPIVRIIATPHDQNPVESPADFVLAPEAYEVVGALNQEITFAVPISARLRGIPKQFMQPVYFDDVAGIWRKSTLEGAYVTGDAMHFRTDHFSTWGIAVYDNIYQVDDTYTTEELAADPTKLYKDLGLALTAIRQVTTAGKRGVILVGKGTYTGPFAIGPNIDLLGGFADKFAVPSNKIVRSEPYDNVSECKVGTASTGQPVFKNEFGAQIDFNIVVDGFKISGGDAGGMELCTQNNVRSAVVSNCHFVGNMGGGGALFLFNIVSVKVQGCVFENNSAPTGVRSDGWSSGCLSSAVNIFQNPTCGVESKIESCVFLTNVAASATGAAVGVYNYLGSDFVNPRITSVTNCTFYNNSNTVSAGASCLYVTETAPEEYFSPSVFLSNSILQNNSASNPQIVGLTVSSTFKNAADAGPFLAVTYCNLPQAGFVNADIDNGNKNDADPKYVAPVTAISSVESIRGFNLQLNSPCRNKGTNAGAPERDLLYRLRRPSVAGGAAGEAFDVVDMGALENYVKVMCVGDQNTGSYGTPGLTYRSTLKAEAMKSGYLLDFVGSATASSTVATGEDPSLPGNSDFAGGYTPSFVDDQYEGSATAKVADITATIGATIQSAKPDHILIMAGRNDVNVSTTTAAMLETSLIALTDAIKSSGVTVNTMVGSLPPVSSLSPAKAKVDAFASRIAAGTIPWTTGLQVTNVNVWGTDKTAVPSGKTLNQSISAISFYTADGYSIIGRVWADALILKLAQ